MQDYSDDQLRDYLAGNLSELEVKQLEAHLAMSPTLEARLLVLEPFADMAIDAFEGTPLEDRLSGLLPNPAPARPSRLPLALVLAASFAGIAGFGLGNFTAPDAEMNWREQIAIYQALYVPETIASLDPSKTDLDRQFAKGSEILGSEVFPAELKGINGLGLRRAQILSSDDKAILQIVFATAEGEPLAFCIVSLGSDAEPTEPKFERLAGVPTAHWVDGDYGYMLVGRLEPDALQTAAQELRARF